MHLASMPGARPPSLTPEPETGRWIGAFVIALGLHVLIIWVLPRLEQTPLAATLRIEVQMSQAQNAPAQVRQVEPEPVQPEVVPPTPPETPKPVKRPDPKPVLVAKEKAITKEEFQLPETAVEPVPTEMTPPPQEVVAPSPPANAASQPATAENADTSKAASSSASIASTDSSEANAQEAWEGYGQLLHAMVSKNKSYPQIAVRRNWQGIAMVSARFVRGKLVEITLVQPSSGYKVLDNAAMEMLRKAVDAVPVRGDLARKSFTVIVPVDFKLEG
jgi:periplasmic protein TonB